VVHVLFFSDPRVRERLFTLVEGSRGLVLVVGVRHGPGMRPPEAREPFASLERAWGDVLTQVLVADEGTVEGMWRDPLGDLGERLFPASREEAYAAASGFLLLEGGRPRAVVRRRGAAGEERWLVQEALSRLTPRVPPPDPAQRPGARRPAATPLGADEATPPRGTRRPPRRDEDVTPPHGTRPPPREPPPPEKKDAWAVLGIAPGTPKDEARRAFRALIAQYHPDKVAHLAPEFHALAERRTREILEAWAEVEREAS
jgi:DnaJ-domain-containing protein 1